MHGVCRSFGVKAGLALKEEAIILKGVVSKYSDPSFSHFETFRLRPDAGKFGHTEVAPQFRTVG